jgi:2-phosphoglycerate kinase
LWLVRFCSPEREPSLNTPKVLLIGGSPGAGKTTLGRASGAKLGIASLTIDHLRTAAKAVTTPQSHPGLHVMSRVNHVEYFKTSSVDQLIADAKQEHEALWPVVEKVIRNHASHAGSAIVIEPRHRR